MRPYYEHGGISIYHGDCRAILPTLAPPVDLVLTDPPYGFGYSTGRRKGLARSSTRIHMDSLAEVEPLLADVADMLEPLLADVAEMYWFAAPERLDTVMPILRRWAIPNVLVWDKGNGTAGDLKATYSKQWEAIIFARKGSRRLVGGRDRDILRFSRGNSSAYAHPTQKPVALMRYLIGRHPVGRCLDPFMGSGTVLRAAKDLGREAVGIEIEERYCEIAARRLEQGALPLLSEAPMPI